MRFSGNFATKILVVLILVFNVWFFIYFFLLGRLLFAYRLRP